MIIQRIRRLATETPPDRPAPPQVTLPNWMLVPGLVALVGSVAAYVAFVRDHPLIKIDFQMYLGAAHAFLDGEPVYQLGYTSLDLPYTYPPVTLPFITPLTWLDPRTALYGWNALGLLAMLGALYLTTGMLGHRGVRGRLGLAAAALALLLWTEPLQRNLSLGQINIFVLLLVVADLSRPDRSRFKGIGVGAATAVKLLPGLFVVYLLLTRRIRAAVVASATFAGLTLLGAIIQPGGSYDYWLTGRAFDSSRVLMTLGPRYGGNQSLQGAVARVLDINEPNNVWWLISVVVVAVAALALAVALQRQGEETMAMVVVGLTMLVVSPVSWSHYWLWIGPMLLVLVDVVRRAGGATRVLAGLVAVAAVLPFLMWPGRTRTGEVIPLGLIWKSGKLEGAAQALALDAYVGSTLILFALAGLWLWHRRRAAVRPTSIPPERVPA
ncbi:glycosyltransferase 87 family protein [Micromonospora sp. WMMD998]|uniref:glycosyltransferase 87 family protein n=1 Tax=Micromonospora sp. WMMD998 TaxID=3016092 RepID=UPI00249B6CE3|nr:glycosyltransferase 87 family protein [Micromonospora sp. WMMD998]WFE39638.1 glycosyltransferase 87 family protein [Micromonospora sp. WMMD998]